jgi:hypothetical protein
VLLAGTIAGLVIIYYSRRAERFVGEHAGFVGVGILAGVLAGAGASTWVDSRNPNARAAPFRASVEEYRRHVEMGWCFTAANEVSGSGVPLRGKLIVLDTNCFDKTEFDPLTFDLPKEIRPDAPEEVQTVAWLSYQDKTVGKYTDGTRAIQSECYVTLVDRATTKVLYRGVILGGLPPDRVVVGISGDARGSSPEPAVLNFLGDYPRGL